MSINVMAMDPGFGKFGVAIIEIDNDKDSVVHVDVIRTNKSNKKTKVLSSTDDDRRGREIVKVLWGLDSLYHPAIYTCEERPLVRNASSSAKIAIGWTIALTLAAIRGVPLVQQSPMNIKLRTAGKKTATKLDIIKAMDKIYPGQFDDFKKKFPSKNPGKPAGAWEHGYDAVASYVASKDEQIIQIARAMSK